MENVGKVDYEASDSTLMAQYLQELSLLPGPFALFLSATLLAVNKNLIQKKY